MFVIKKTKGQKLSMCTMKCFCVKNQRMSFWIHCQKMGIKWE